MKYISFVFQNTKLFKTSLLENIKYGNPDATMEEVERAVDMAQCREIINKLPLGLNTKIGTEEHISPAGNSNGSYWHVQS